jgi:hypothetical protein
MRSQHYLGRPEAGQSVAYTGTHGVISNAVADHIHAVIVWTTTTAHIAVGTAPAATTSDFPIPANVPIPLRISPGEKVSAIQVDTGGTLFVGELDL